jgi:hypothetical protein
VQRKPAFALNRLASNLGMSIGPAIGGILAHISFRLLFFIDGATSIVASTVVLLASWPQISPASSRVPALSTSEFGGAEEFGRELEAESIEPLAPARLVADLGAFRDARMLYFLAAVVPVQIVFFQVTSTLPLFLVRYLGLRESVYGLVFTINTLIIVALEGSSQYRHGALGVSPHSRSRSYPPRDRLRLVWTGNAPARRCCVCRGMDVWRNDLYAQQCRLRIGNRATPSPSRIHGPLRDVVQHRVLRGSVDWNTNPAALGASHVVGGRFRLGLLVNAASDPHSSG